MRVPKYTTAALLLLILVIGLVLAVLRHTHFRPVVTRQRLVYLNLLPGRETDGMAVLQQWMQDNDFKISGRPSWAGKTRGGSREYWFKDERDGATVYINVLRSNDLLIINEFVRRPAYRPRPDQSSGSQLYDWWISDARERQLKTP